MMQGRDRRAGSFDPWPDEQDESPFLHERFDPPPADEDLRAAELGEDEEELDDGADLEFEDEGDDGAGDVEEEAPCSCGRLRRELARSPSSRGSSRLLRALAQAHRALGEVLRELSSGDGGQRELDEPVEELEAADEGEGGEDDSAGDTEDEADFADQEAPWTEAHEAPFMDGEAFEGEAFEGEAFEGEAFEGEDFEDEAFEDEAFEGENFEDEDAAGEGGDALDQREAPFLTESSFPYARQELEGPLSPDADTVRWAQTILNRVEGEQLDPDGRLGRLTRLALRRFQQRYGLTPTGDLDGATNTALWQRGIEQTQLQSIFPTYGAMSTALMERISALRTSQGLSFFPLLDAASRAALVRALETPRARPSEGAARSDVRGTIERAIQETLDAFQNVRVGTNTVHVPYFINKKGLRSNDYAVKHRPALLAKPGVAALYATLDPPKGPAARGKATPEHVRAFLARGYASGVLPGALGALSPKEFLRQLGVGIDCSGFVSQALTACLRALGESEKVSEGSTNLRVGDRKRHFEAVARPRDLLPGDTMWKPGHIRIVHKVTLMGDGTLQVVTFESTSRNGVGPSARTWVFPRPDDFTSLIGGDKINEWSRHRSLARLYAQGRAVRPAARPLPPSKAVAPAPLAPEVAEKGKPNPADYRKFRVTTYYVARQNESSRNGPPVPILGADGRELARVSPAFFAKLSLEGSGRLDDGRLIGVTGKSRAVDASTYAPVLAYHKSAYKTHAQTKYGYSGIQVKGDRVTRALTFHVKPPGALGYGVQRDISLEPFRTLAVDLGLKTCSEKGLPGYKGVVPARAHVYIPWFAGRTLPDGSVHDGWFRANDTGGGIFGAHFDLFTGTKANSDWLAKQLGAGLSAMDAWFAGIERHVPADYRYGLDKKDCDKRKGKTA